MNDCIKYRDPDTDDPDWCVKSCYTLLFAATSEMECGIEKFWKRGISNERRSYPDFGQYVPITSFKAFCSANAYAWADKKFWYLEKRDRPWDIFVPCLQSYNDQRRTLIISVLIILDVSMLEWCTKTSKLGGIPNISYETLKPVPLGNMFKNRVECISGVLAFQYIVQGR